MTLGDDQQRARVFADVLDFPIYVSHADDNTRLPGGPWRVWDFCTCIVGIAATLWATYKSFDNGSPTTVALFGLALTGAATILARQIPISRPSPFYRALWLFSSVFGTQRRAAANGRRDPWLSPPEAVIDNLVFTRNGVYAEFLVSGQPAGMMPFDEKRDIGDRHRPLARQLPSGMVLWGVCARLSPIRLKRRMLAGKEHQPRWVREVRDWDAYLDPSPESNDTEKRFNEWIFGVRVPVDAGLAGRSGAGIVVKWWNALIGRDHDDPQTLEAYRQTAEEVRRQIPSDFAARPATPLQIKWLYHRRWTLGADDSSFPHDEPSPRRLTAADFDTAPCEFDEGDQQGRRRSRSWLGRHLPSMKRVLRIRSADGTESYQALLALAELPRGGLSFPGAEYLMAAYDVDIDAQVDWYHHVIVNSREKALQRVDRAQRNLDDQVFQREGRRSSDTDLVQRYQSSEDYSAALESSSLERETQWTTVIAVGSPTLKSTQYAAQQLRTHYAEELETSLALPRGAQRALWQLGHPGSEDQAPRSQFHQPTTTENWARFSPFLSSDLGHETGILFAENLATRRPTPVLVDMEGIAGRRGAPGMLFIGASGGGKSQGSKRVVDGLIKRGNQTSIIDPGTMREWEKALAHHGDRVAAIDPTGGNWSLDGLRLFPREKAAEHMLDHLLPMMGIAPDDRLADKFRLLLRPDRRVAESMGGVLRYLNDLRGAEQREYSELTEKLNSWATEDYLRAVFDESLPAPPIREKDAVIWLTSELELPKISNTEQVHLYLRQSRRARAGLAIYGMIASLTRLTYTGDNRPRPGAFGWLVTEEARTYLTSPVGRDDTERIATQGRKEHYGWIGISQHVEDFEGIGIQELPMRVITPFKPTEPEYARQAFKKLGIDPDEYPEVLKLRTVDGHGYAYFLDDLGRCGLVDLLPPVQPELVEAFDTRYLEPGSQAVA
ncbi:ATP-binding protein [Mycolicibacterium goodii]|uniref:ATP-binding protein n=1 Tax=Mycolicibacterium goodii TaxID=134601 RepID=UPI001BDDAC63|nr:ATP-binding protein [Mycolicibacterium goodii]MBU8819253.1 ATP-binding protein [Mycolicibacterium goodii]